MKKIIALLLALATLLSLAACSVKVNPGETTETTEAPTLEGKLTKFASPDWDGSLPLVAEGEDNVLTIGIRTNANVLDFDTNKLTLWLEEQTGLDLQFAVFPANSKDAATQVSLMVAGGEELPDILLGFSGINKATAKEYIRDGYLLDLAPYLATNAFYTRQSMDIYYAETPDVLAETEKFMIDNIIDPVSGAAIGFPGVFNNPADSNLSHIWINQQWLDTLGLKQPTNITELKEVLIAFRDGDPNGNGKKDEIPAIGRADDFQSALLQWIMNAFIFEYDKYRYIVEDDVVSAPYHTDEYRQGIIFMKELVDEGLLSPMCWTATKEEIVSLVNPTEGSPYTVGIFAGPGDSWFEDGHQSIWDYSVQGPLADETGKGGWAPTTVDQVDYANYITTDCDKPLIAFRFLDFLSSGEGYLRQRWGEKGVDWDYADENEPLPGFLGGKARIVVHNPLVFAEVNNQTWHMQRSVCSEGYWQYAQDLSDGSWKSQMCLQLQAIKANYDAGKHPAQQIYNVNRTEENDEAWTEANSNIASYYKQARAEFCTGVRDPKSDADWQTYLNDLDNLRYHEDWIGPAQTSWDMDKAAQ